MAITTAPFTTTQRVGRPAPPLKVVASLPGTDLGSPATGVKLYNFGSNASGWEEVTINAPAGTTLTFTPSEILSNGRVTQSKGATGAPICDTFTSNGTTKTWHPSFVYHGMQYLEISGVTADVTISDPKLLVIRASNTDVGDFTSSDPTINSIHTLVDRALQSNMMSILTDCPDREKLGWDEQDQLLFEMMARNYDIDAYGRGTVQRLADAQRTNGLVPDIAPEVTVFTGGFLDDVNWGSSIIMMPWEMYETYGDSLTLTTFYTNMTRYMAYLNGKATGGLVTYPSGLGDWGEKTLSPAVSTPIDLVENYGYYRAQDALANIATVLGKTADAATYRTNANATLSAFTAKWYDAANHTVANGTQAALALALDMGAVPTADIAATVATLVAAVNAQGTLAVGEIGLPAIFRVLSSSGNNQLLYDVVTPNKIGSYGYFPAHGATSLPEYWNMSASENHFMLGAVDLWLSDSIAGIQQAPGSVGYRQLVIKPAVVGNMTSASNTFTTNYGDVTSSWNKSASTGTFSLDVAIPVGSTATVYVPLSAGQSVTEGSTGTAAASGVTAGAIADGYASFTVGSGNYHFVAAVPADTTAPVVTAAINPAVPSGAAGWYTDAVSLTLAATDDASGVASVEYQLGTGAWTAYTAPVVVPEGDNTVSFQATDSAGNVSAVQAVSIKRDATAPVTSAVFDDRNGAAEGPVAVTLSATDAASGVDSISYSVDGGSWTTYRAPVSVSGAGVHTVAYKAVDVAGNVAAEQTASVTLYRRRR